MFQHIVLKLRWQTFDIVMRLICYEEYAANAARAGRAAAHDSRPALLDLNLLRFRRLKPALNVKPFPPLPPQILACIPAPGGQKPAKRLRG